jgi:succinylglutamate desuccinylase
MGRIQRVLIAGGTHGNELIGVYTVKKFQQCPELIRRSSFETVTLLGNPEAIAAGRRYVDQDLNRCFATALTEESTHWVYEVQRAEEIRQAFGSTGRTPVDFVIDQHGTTANVGLMLILDQLDPFTLCLSAHLSSVQPDIRIYCSSGSGRKQDSLRSIGRYRVGIEVGAIAHGTLHAALFQKTELLIHAILDYLEHYNCNHLRVKQSSLTVYQYMNTIDYPRHENGEISAMIHPQLQFKDFEALNPGDSLFLTFDNQTIVYSGDATVYPVFINEAAYYEKGIAMCLTQKQHLPTNA